MGVHDNKGYYPQIKSLLGIPEDEPIFILRGQDKAACDTIDSYCEHASGYGASEGFLANAEGVGNEFDLWASQNRDKMKVPD